MSSTGYSCPYFVGAEFLLLLTSSRPDSAGRPPAPIYVRVIETFEFTQSQTTIQTSSEKAEIPPIALLKLFDRYLGKRSPNSRDLTAIWRPDVESKAIWNPDVESTAETRPPSTFTEPTDTTDKLEVRDDMDADRCSGFDSGSYEDSMSETELEYQLASDTAPIDQWLIEERFRHRTRILVE